MTTSIEWTRPPGYKGEAWNPTTGCSHVSSGCDNCYAARQAHRGLCEAHVGLTVMGEQGPLAGRPIFNGKVKLHGDRLDIPLRWRDPRCVFVDSMSDLFHEAVPFDFIDQVFAVMALTPKHRYIILTKRPLQMSRYISKREPSSRQLLPKARRRVEVIMRIGRARGNRAVRIEDTPDLAAAERHPRRVGRGPGDSE